MYRDGEEESGAGLCRKEVGKQVGSDLNKPYGKCNIICVDIFRPSVDSQQYDIKIIQFELVYKKLKYHIMMTSITIARFCGMVGCVRVFWVGLVRCIFSGGMCFVLHVSKQSIYHGLASTGVFSTV